MPERRKSRCRGLRDLVDQTVEPPEVEIGIASLQGYHHASSSVPEQPRDARDNLPLPSEHLEFGHLLGADVPVSAWRCGELNVRSDGISS